MFGFCSSILNLLIVELSTYAAVPADFEAKAPVLVRAIKAPTIPITTTLVITIPAIAPPPNPEEFFLYLAV